MNDTNSGPVQTGNESTQASASGGLQIELRDWFAGMALQGLAGPTITDAARQRVKPENVPPQLAIGCYAIADAMIAARKEAR